MQTVIFNFYIGPILHWDAIHDCEELRHRLYFEPWMMISTLLMSLSLVLFWSQRFLILKGVSALILRLGHRQNLPILKTRARTTELNWVRWYQDWAATLLLSKGCLNSTSTTDSGLLIVLDRSLSAFQSLQHPLLKRRQLGRGLVHRSPRTLFSGIHKPLSLVLRFKSHGLPTVLHQKLHTQHDGVRKSIQFFRTELDELPEQTSDPSGVEPLGLTSCQQKALETVSTRSWQIKLWSCCYPTKLGHSSRPMGRKTIHNLNEL